MIHRRTIVSVLLGALGLSLVGCANGNAGPGGAAVDTSAMKITKSDFGQTPDGQKVEAYTLVNAKGSSAKIITYGGIVTELNVPDKDGVVGNVVLGFDSLDKYTAGHPFFGAIAGRVANRIAKGKFKIGDTEYTLATNNGPNHLHGGKVGFDKRVWDALVIQTNLGPALRLAYTSPDGEEGYPGTLDAVVIYTLTNANELRIDYRTTARDKATPINITNHSYFNLSGESSGKTILDHEMMINADAFTPVDATLIPTGEIKSVKGTPFDFTNPKKIGQDIAQTGGDPSGYDHNFVLNGVDGVMKRCAVVTSPDSGRVMEIWTTQPGVQFYTGNFLDGKINNRAGQPYVKHAAFCLETQHFPDSINQPKFPNTLLQPGESFTSTTIHRFGTK